MDPAAMEVYSGHVVKRDIRSRCLPHGANVNSVKTVTFCDIALPPRSKCRQECDIL